MNLLGPSICNTSLLFCTSVIQVSVDAAHGYTPRAIDMSNVTLSRDLHVSLIVVSAFVFFFYLNFLLWIYVKQKFSVL